jgi:ubiquinone/menaquinone biosynthesis C-methylase UbiE
MINIQQKYDQEAASYERMTLLPEWVFLHRFRRALFQRAKGTILEVAIGAGKNFAYFPKNSEIVGIDLSTVMMEMAAKRAEKLGLNAKFFQMDATNLDFPDKTFDTVVSSLSLCIYPDPVAVLKEMGRVCKPSGRILLMEHGKSSARWLSDFQDKRSEQFVKVVGCHWNREPAELVAQAGLRLIRDERSILGMFHRLEIAPE